MSGPEYPIILEPDEDRQTLIATGHAAAAAIDMVLALDQHGLLVNDKVMAILTACFDLVDGDGENEHAKVDAIVAAVEAYREDRRFLPPEK